MTSDSPPPHPTVSLDSPSSVGDRVDDRRMRAGLRTVRVVLVSYLLDAAQLAAFAWLGVVPWLAVGAFTTAGVSACVVLEMVLRSRQYSRQKSEVALNLGMTLYSCGLMLAMTVWVPQVGVLMLMTVLVVMATSALHLPGRHLAPLSAMLAACALLAIGLSDGRLNMPTDTWPQSLVTGFWFALLLTKVALTNVLGRELRVSADKLSRELAVALDQVQRLARTDGLTGLLNRRAILALVEEEATRARRTGEPFSLAILDIDRFKGINDTLGHTAGDEVLKHLASLLGAAVRGADKVSRYGGEEFLVLMASPCDEKGAWGAMERLRATVAASRWPGCGELVVTASIGFATVRGSETITEAIRRADEALYRAKNTGRNRVEGDRGVAGH
jgi:diguanylate cyclase (GGDEF)-like protein